MEPRPIILVVRLWWRNGNLITEVRSLHGEERRYFKSAAELLQYFETLEDEIHAPREGEGK